MKPVYKGITVAVMLLAFAAAIACGCGGGAKARSDVKVSVAFLSGTVETQTGGAPEWKKASQNAEITMADAIRTGEKSFAKLNFPDGSKVFLDESTTLNLTEVKLPAAEKSTLDIVLEVITGSIFCDVSKRENSKFEVETSTAVAGVKGTRFTVCMERAKERNRRRNRGNSAVSSDKTPAPEGDITSVIVLEGMVEVKKRSGAIVTLASEEIAEITNDQKQPEKEKLDLAKEKFAGIPLMKTLSPEDITQRIQVLSINK